MLLLLLLPKPLPLLLPWLRLGSVGRLGSPLMLCVCSSSARARGGLAPRDVEGGAGSFSCCVGFGRSGVFFVWFPLGAPGSPSARFSRGALAAVFTAVRAGKTAAAGETAAGTVAAAAAAAAPVLVGGDEAGMAGAREGRGGEEEAAEESGDSRGRAAPERWALAAPPFRSVALPPLLLALPTPTTSHPPPPPLRAESPRMLEPAAALPRLLLRRLPNDRRRSGVFAAAAGCVDCAPVGVCAGKPLFEPSAEGEEGAAGAAAASGEPAVLVGGAWLDGICGIVGRGSNEGAGVE